MRKIDAVEQCRWKEGDEILLGRSGWRREIIYCSVPLSNADGRRENNIAREEWRECRLLIKLPQLQL
eukprot:scaffold2248_cov136-Skeletonema_dohrnii-CCMP3373.AAC.22